MNKAKLNSRIIGDDNAATDSSSSSFFDCNLPKLLLRLEDSEEHKEFKDLISSVQDDDDCSIESCDLDHKALAFLLRSGIERFSCKESYNHQDHDKDNSSEDNPYNIKGKASGKDEGDEFVKCGSISCRSSSRRSFGFPVLRSEWVGSPVRMVEIDHRRHRRRQRRRSCFLCADAITSP